MAKEHEVRKALGGGHKKEGGRKLHTHGVHYERAHNGGIIAHVHRHFGEGPRSEGHSHDEEHVLPDTESAQEHMQEHMGDQPAAGEMQSETQAPAPPEPDAAGGGGGAMPGM